MNAEKIVSLPGRVSQGIEHGTVRGGGDEGYLVHGPSGIFVAKAAFSCLVKPISGDRVMYTRDPEGGSYILSILDRATNPDAVISFPGDVLVEAAKGRVTFAAGSGIDLSTSSSVNMLASDVTVAAATGQINIAELQANGESFTGTISNVRLFADVVDTVAQRLTQRLQICVRWVEEIEHVTAGQMMTKVRNLFSVRARQSAITAIDDAKIDAKRVHIG